MSRVNNAVPNNSSMFSIINMETLKPRVLKFKCAHYRKSGRVFICALANSENKYQVHIFSCVGKKKLEKRETQNCSSNAHKTIEEALQEFNDFVDINCVDDIESANYRGKLVLDDVEKFLEFQGYRLAYPSCYKDYRLKRTNENKCGVCLCLDRCIIQTRIERRGNIKNTIYSKPGWCFGNYQDNPECNKCLLCEDCKAKKCQ